MKLKYNLLLSINLLFISFTFSQDLTCEDFKSGKFYIPITNELKKYSTKSGGKETTHSFSLKPNINNIVVIRSNNSQIEYPNGINGGSPIYEIIEWINDCTYRLTFDAEKMKLDPKKKWVNENKGIIVSNLGIKGKCMNYTAVMTTNQGKEILQKGMICKE